METLHILLADNNYLIREGLKSVIIQNIKCDIVGEIENGNDVLKTVKKTSPDVLIVDYLSATFNLNQIQNVIEQFPKTKILAITGAGDKLTIATAVKLGINSYVFKDCDKQEIIDAVKSTAKGEKFYCGKILEALNSDTFDDVEISCAPIKISSRESEIIRLVSQGYTNKDIADQLCLSIHTVVTHRKNIMNKLGLTNTADLVMFAIKEKILVAN